MYRLKLICAASGVFLLAMPTTQAQTILSQFKFDGNLLNESTFVDTNSVPAPDGTFREGADAATAVPGAATFGRGVDGTAGGALRLDGVDDWVDLTTAGHPGQPIAGTFTSGPGLVSGTVMAWVRLDNALDATPRWLMGNVNAANTQSYRFGWNGTRIESSASGSANANNKFTVTDSTANPNVAWADGAWHHIAAAWDGFLNNGRIYVDGVQIGPASTGTTLHVGTAQAPWAFPMALGARDNGGALDGFWSGLIDDVRIYAGQLTSAQVLGVFNATTVAPNPAAGPADFDADGDVDGGDFLIWQRGFGVGTTPAEGDADDNDVVDGADLAVWSGAFGQVAEASAAVAAVPEPSAALLLLAGVAGFAVVGRRCD